MEKLGNYILDIAAGPFGSNLKVECFVPTGFPIIDGANLKSFKVTDNISKFVTEEKARSLHRSIAQKNDVIVTISGNVGQISYIPEDSKYEEYLVSQRQFRVTFDTTRIYVPFLVYYFHTKEGQHKILSFANQTGVPALAQPLKNFRNIDVDFPDIVIQKKIANILESIDDKIENNKQINDNLEQQAQALYKSWFVDFEPFKDGEFIESEIGEIPAGWSIVKFGDIVEIPKKTINPQKFPDTIFNHYSLPACDNGLIAEVQAGKDIMSNKIILQSNTTLFSKLNPRIKRIWFTCEVLPNSICSTEFIPYRAKIDTEYSYIFSIVNSDAFYSSVMGCVNGATGSHQRFHAEDTEDFLCAYNKDAVNEFSKLIEPVLKQMHDLRQENVKLALTRDTLLPKLMSGELKINDLDC